MGLENSISINLESLIELSARLNETSSEFSILNVALLSLMGKLRSFKAAALKINENGCETIIRKGQVNISTIPKFKIDSFRKLNSDSEEIELINSGLSFAIPLKTAAETLYIIALGAPLLNKDYSADEKRYADLVASIAANAIINARNINSIVNSQSALMRRNQLLSAMFEMNKEFSTFVNIKQIIQALTYRILGQLTTAKYAIFSIDENKQTRSLGNLFKFEFVKTEIDFAFNLEKPILLSNCPKNAIVENLIGKKVSAIVPLYYKKTKRGIIFIGERMTNQVYTEENLLFAEAIGLTALTAIENARLFEQELDKKKLESELNLALDIQRGLLPKELPKTNEFSIYGISVPSKQIGGDYYDFIELDKNRILTAIADVSGKGMPAALLMANVQAALRALSALDMELEEMLLRINSVVFQNTTPDKFVTFFYGILEKNSGEFKYINAGHNPPYLLKSDGRLEELKAGGLILGILPDPPDYDIGEIKMEKDDLLIMYTDGVSEGMSPDRQEFGEERLKELIKNNAKLNSKEIVKKIVDSVKEHAASAPQSDDLTIAAIKRAQD